MKPKAHSKGKITDPSTRPKHQCAILIIELCNVTDASLALRL